MKTEFFYIPKQTWTAGKRFPQNRSNLQINIEPKLLKTMRAGLNSIQEVCVCYSKQIFFAVLYLIAIHFCHMKYTPVSRSLCSLCAIIPSKCGSNKTNSPVSPKVSEPFINTIISVLPISFALLRLSSTVIKRPAYAVLLQCFTKSYPRCSIKLKKHGFKSEKSIFLT